METNQPEALRLAALLNADEWPCNMTLVSYVRECVAELTRLHAENETLQAGYDAARMEIASLHERLESSKKNNDDLAAKTHALEAKNIGLLHALTAEQDENHALHQQLAAIGAGGVEPLRKRECLHQIAEPAPLNKATAEHALRRILHIVQRYLPPDGMSIDKAMNEIIAVVDPWPVAEGDAGMYPQLPSATMFATVLDDVFAIGNIGVYTPDQMRAYVDADRAAQGGAA